MLKKIGVLFVSVVLVLNLNTGKANAEDIGETTLQTNEVKIEKKVIEEVIESGQHKGHRRQRKFIALNTGRIIYTIESSHWLDPVPQKEGTSIEHRVGLHSPTYCNWYSGGFIYLDIDNRKNILSFTEPTITTKKEKGKGIVNFDWATEEAKIKLSFICVGDDDKLLLKVTINPHQTIESLVVRLHNFPSFFTRQHKKKGARYVITPVETLEEMEKTEFVNVSIPSKFWAFYADRIFDCATNKRAAGPSAMMCLASEVEKIEIKVTDYPIITCITYPKDTTEFHLAFWEFPKTDNENALEYLKTQIEKTENLLKNVF